MSRKASQVISSIVIGSMLLSSTAFASSSSSQDVSKHPVTPVTPPSPIIHDVSTGTTVNMYSTQITRLHPARLDVTLPIKWTTSDPYVAYVDTIGNSAGNYAGKVLGVSAGTATITGVQGSKSVTVTIKVKNDPNLATNLEKIVYYYNAGDAQIPDFSYASALNNTSITAPAGRTWPVAGYAGYLVGLNGKKWMLASDMASVTLYDPTMSNPIDQIQYLQGGRYIPQNSSGVTQPISQIMTDANGGLWIKDAAGDATHIVRKQMSLQAKSLLQEEVSSNIIDRYGYQSGGGSLHFASQTDKLAAIMGTKDQTDIVRGLNGTDNDGTWTSLYGMGEIARYNYMRATYGDGDARTIDAKASATRATEAVTLLAYISGRQLKVPAKEEVQPYVLALLGANLNGSDEGKPVFMKADGTYTLDPAGNQPVPDGYISRSYDIGPDGNTRPAVLNDANRWLHKDAGTTTDVNGNTIHYAALLNASSNSNNTNYAALKSYSNIPVPTRLRKIYDPNLNIADNRVYYKDDTSSDELVADYAFYNMAYDTFKTVDPELAGLIKTAVIANMNSIIINNYYLAGLGPRIAVSPDYRINGAKYDNGFSTQASGHGLNFPAIPSKWGNFNPEFLDGSNNIWNRSDYEDGPLNALIVFEMLQTAMKFTKDNTTAYSTDTFKAPTPLDYAEEFNTMTTSSLYKARYPKALNSTSLLDMIQQYHSRYFGIAAHNGDDLGVPGVSFENYLNYSDEEEAASVFYGIAATLPNNLSLDVLNAYHNALNQWWYNEKRSKNPFLTNYYAVSLALLKARGVDTSADQVDTVAAAWALTRMPSNLGYWDVNGSGRNDVTNLLGGTANDTWVDQLLPRDEFRMTKYNGTWFDPNGGNDMSMESSTAVSTPFWFAMDPTNAALISQLGNANINPLNAPVPAIKDVATNNTVVEITLQVGENKNLDVTGNVYSYIKNISWVTESWNNESDQTLDLRTRYDDTKNAIFYGAVITGLKAGTTTVTAMTSDGGFAAPRIVTYNVKVVDANSSVTATSPANVSEANFAYPAWLVAAMNDAGINTDGHVNVTVKYSSISTDDGTVDSTTGAITYRTSNPFNIIATVTYSDMTQNGDPMFEKNSHVMTFVCPVHNPTP